MKSFLLVVSFILVGALSAFAITLDEVLAKNLEARGGLAKLKGITSLSFDGTMSMAQGMEMTFTQSTKRPSKYRMDLTVQGMSMIQAYDGTTAWAVSPMAGNKPEKQPATEAKRLAEQADMDGLLVDWKTKGYTLELVGPEDIDGATAYKIKVTDKDKDVKFVFIDATTWLDAKLSMRINMMGQEADVDLFLSNYQDVAGVQTPMQMEMRQDGQVMMVITYSNPKVNVDIPDSRFAFPAESPVKKN